MSVSTPSRVARRQSVASEKKKPFSLVDCEQLNVANEDTSQPTLHTSPITRGDAEESPLIQPSELFQKSPESILTQENRGAFAVDDESSMTELMTLPITDVEHDKSIISPVVFTCVVAVIGVFVAVAFTMYKP